MVVISYRTIRNFVARHQDAEDALNNWYRITEQADWSNFNEMRRIFGSVDAAGNDLYVFNIRGGNYRMVVRIFSLLERSILSSSAHIKNMTN